MVSDKIMSCLLPKKGKIGKVAENIEKQNMINEQKIQIIKKDKPR